MRYLLIPLVCLACGETPGRQSDVERITAAVIPQVERATGLAFRAPPVVATRDRAQVAAYLRTKLDAEFPPEMLDRISSAYRLFGLIADTTDLRALLLALLGEQVVGFYDPDSTALYVVADADPAQLRFIISHELVHALQDQYVALDSMLELQHQNDAKMAFQAIMEGQATLGAVAAMLPEQDLQALPDFWRDYRQTIRRQQEQMPVFSRAPLILREGLVFPYVAGMDFMRWFNGTYPDTVPYGPRMPASTEQILHPERYRTGDEPVRLRFDAAGAGGAAGAAGILYEDNLGEFESGILMWELTGSESVGAASVLGWDGDRYAVFPAGDDRALVWWTVWDDATKAAKFAAVLRREWPDRLRPGRRHVIQETTVAAIPAVVLVDAPQDWPGLTTVPTVSEEPR